MQKNDEVNQKLNSELKGMLKSSTTHNEDNYKFYMQLLENKNSFRDMKRQSITRKIN